MINQIVTYEKLQFVQIQDLKVQGVKQQERICYICLFYAFLM